ncbi:hypothetical protein NXY43_20750 [Bacteroides fragilis]|nr:hypothetical protein [Bacteroides fragilis]
MSEKTVERHINEALKLYVRTSIYFLYFFPIIIQGK